LGVAARQGDGNDVALLALKRINRAHAESALQNQVSAIRTYGLFYGLMPR
jgi:hypothetical protein